MKHGRWPVQAALKRSCCLGMSLATLMLGGCATMVKPEDLSRPAKLSCFEVPQIVEAHEVRGLLDIPWVTKLAQGPYVAERENAEGTYYRAPPGGIHIAPAAVKADAPPAPLMPRVFDGGIWIPKTPGTPAHLYTYFSTQEAAVVPLPEAASCQTAQLVKDPDAKGVSAVAFATGGLIGGTAGGLVGRSVSSNSSVSYGQAAGAGAVGGALGGLIVAGLINMDVGKIVHHPLSKDAKFQSALQDMSAKVVLVVPSALPDEAAATKP
ncbi:hypothetical protein [Aquabacterium sp.]|uniref:hypothetical protein n=1 Tax=Aquabacterium sp. TaxID=1872578 RepID=UPI0024891AE2|nr:hypothetical protein [Aquabacterium sp.]MDI1260269.1 hypothetical protein [Aquabacterium sp.]